MKKKKEILKNYFGFNTFKPIQEEAIDYILEKKDILTILPTGSGKSLIFQLPTLMMNGVTVVISPLIALMQDQVANLNANGISANMMTSQNSLQENNQTKNDLYNNRLKFLYIAPERFVNEDFIFLLKSININFFVIDEAHCVSEWGHEFRDDYRKLSFLKSEFPNIPISAFSATATNSVQEDIVKTLKIDSQNILKGKIKRDNLIIRVEKRVNGGKEQIVNFLKVHKDECGIIYCFTRKETENLSTFLNQKGFDTLYYHAGLPSIERDEVFKKFKNEEVKIVIATIAFGMGIDKGNIRFVLHTSMPKTLENYSQEIGRAGRDGLKSDVLLLYSKSDEINKKRLIDDLPESNYKLSNYKKLENMYKFSRSLKCRHQLIANYFDDKIQNCETMCDNCSREEIVYKDISIESQKILSTILRCNQKFGQNHIIDVLRGSTAKKILDFKHNELSVYGIGKDISKKKWSIIVDTLLDIDAIYIDIEFKTLLITNRGMDVLKGKEKVKIDKRDIEEKSSYDDYEIEIDKNELFEEFKSLRTKISKEEKVPPFIIFSDKVLNEIAKKLPITEKEFLSISGLGEQKLKKYGKSVTQLSKKIRKNIEEKKPKKELTKTYIDTFELINQNKTIKEITKERELQDSTIIKHIQELYENSYIKEEKKENLLKPIIDEFPKDLKKWIETKLKSYEIQDLRKYLSQYASLFINEEKKN